MLESITHCFIIVAMGVWALESGMHILDLHRRQKWYNTKMNKLETARELDSDFNVLMHDLIITIQIEDSHSRLSRFNNIIAKRYAHLWTKAMDGVYDGIDKKKREEDNNVHKN